MVQGYSQEAISANISTLMSEGRSQDQAVAISLEVARKAWRRVHPRGKYPPHLSGVRKPSRHRRKKKMSPSAYLDRIGYTLVYGYGYSTGEASSAISAHERMIADGYQHKTKPVLLARRIARGA